MPTTDPNITKTTDNCLFCYKRTKKPSTSYKGYNNKLRLLPKDNNSGSNIAALEQDTQPLEQEVKTRETPT